MYDDGDREINVEARFVNILKRAKKKETKIVKKEKRDIAPGSFGIREDEDMPSLRF